MPKVDSIKVGGVRLKIYDDDNFEELTRGVVINGERMGTGLVPRDPNKQPVGYSMAAAPTGILLFPDSEDEARAKFQEDNKSSLQHLRMIGDNGKMIKSLNQKQLNYCWNYSLTTAALLLDAKTGIPPRKLSSCSVGAPMVGGRNEGGWGALALERARDVGWNLMEDWPEQSRNLALDNPANRAKAAANKVTADWCDIQSPVYDRNMTERQVTACLLGDSPMPVVCDLMWWGHAITAIRQLRIEAGRWGRVFWNTWGDEYEDHGMVILSGSKMVPDNAVAPTTLMAA